MKGHVFNIDNGYLEGLCRGFKNGILRQGDYLNLVQCETLEGKVFTNPILCALNKSYLGIIKQLYNVVLHNVSFYSVYILEVLQIVLAFVTFLLLRNYCANILTKCHHHFRFKTTSAEHRLRKLLGKRSKPSPSVHHRRQPPRKARHRVPTHAKPRHW